MKIVSIQKQSFIEYPEKISAVIFLGGCNMRCQFCYVPDLVFPERIRKVEGIPQKDVFSFLEERRNFLDAVAISGGEPTIHKELPDFIRKIKEMDYLVELETNGTNFEMLRNLIKKRLVDYVAVDIKHDFIFWKWYEITGGVLTKELFENVKKSIKFLLKGKVNYEFRTTLVKEFHKKEDIVAVCKKIKGARVYFLQNFEKTGKRMEGKNFTPFSKEEIQAIIEEGKKYTNIKARAYLFQ